MLKELKKYDEIADNLAIIFVEKYFGKGLIFDDDYYWIGSQDEDREVLCVNDYFFTIERIIDSLRYNCPSKKLFEYQEIELELAMKDKLPKMNFRNFIKYKKIKKTNGK